MTVDEIKKVTANLPKELLDRAISETGEGVTETLRHGLRLILSHSAAAKLLDYKGKIQLSVNLEEARADR